MVKAQAENSADMLESKLDRGQNCSDLPLELWEEIYKSLHICDRIRFASIGKAWLSIASAKHQSPLLPESWLMFPNPNGYQVSKNYNEFLCLSNNRVYKFDNVIPHDCIILGASNGWVLTERPNPQVKAWKNPMILANPTLNAEIKLPPVHCTVGDIKKVVVVVKKINSAEKTEADVPGVIILGDGKNASITCHTDAQWFYSASNYAVDILVHNRKFYSLTIHWLSPFLTARDLDEQLKPYTWIWKDVIGTDTKERFSGSSEEAKLVGSREDLLLVKRLFNHSTVGFVVFKIQRNDKTGPWSAIELRSLGDQALFWGKDGCFSLPVGKFSPFEENHIYFSIPEDSVRLGVYSLKYETVKQIANLRPGCFQRESTWFVPTIKDRIVDLDRGKQN